MRRVLFIGIVGALLLAACSRPSEVIVEAEAASQGQRGISVSGEGEIRGAPDTLTASIGVSVLRDTADEAVAAAAGLAEDLIDTLSDAGVEAEDVQTSNYSIFPEYDFPREGGRELLGFRVSNELTVQIRDLENAGALFDAAAEAAGDEIVVRDIRFSIEDDEALIEEARTEAWNDAEGKAEQLADLGGVRLGPPTSITEGVTVTPVAAREFAVAEEVPAPVTPIEPGQVPVTVTIEVTFSILSN